MTDQTFSVDYYVDTLVQLLDKIKYQDNNYDHSKRVKNLKYAYSEAARHFAQPLQQDTLKGSLKILEKGLPTIVIFVVYGWSKASSEVIAALTIHYTYILLLDDSNNNPHQEMATFFEDLVRGRQQKNPWLRVTNEYLPNLLSHYGGYCSFNIVRSTFDCK